MKKHNLNRRFYEARNIYPADFYEFNNLLTKNGWAITDFVDLEKHGKKYTGIRVYNKRYEAHPRYVSLGELKSKLEDYFDGNVDFTTAQHKYAPEITELTIVVEPDVFDYADDQLEFDFNESRNKIKTLSKFRESQEDTAFIRSVNLKNGERVALGIWCDNHDLMHKAEDYVRHEYGNRNISTFDILYGVEKIDKKAYSRKTKESYTIRKNAKNLK